MAAASKPDSRAQVTKARRAVLSDGVGGMSSRSKKKRSERLKPTSTRGFGKNEGSGLNYDRRPRQAAECACGSGLSYGDCICSTLHDGGKADTPDDLVRARYTAYTYRLPDFLMRTTDPAGEEYNAKDVSGWKKELLDFCDSFEFQKLQVGSVTQGAGTIAVSEGEKEALTPAELAQVDFKVDFVQKGTLNLMVLCEKSTFRKQADGEWLYAQGEVGYDAQSVELSEEEQQRLHEKVAEQQQKDAKTSVKT